MRRSHVSVVEWCNELFKVQKALGEEAMRGGGGQGAFFAPFRGLHDKAERSMR